MSALVILDHYAVETLSVVVASLTALTLTYVVRDRRYRVMHDLWVAERQRADAAEARVSELSARVQALEARPDLERHAKLLGAVMQSMQRHEDAAVARAEAHERRAQERTDATVTVLRQIADRIESVFS